MSRGGEQEGRLFYGWWIVAACFLLLLLQSGAGYYSFSIFIRPLERDFGWSRAAIAATMSIHMVAAACTGPLVGKMVQAWGPRRVMICGALGSGAFFILVSAANSLAYLYVVYGLLALAISSMGILPTSSLITRWFVRRRGTATGVAMVGMSVGGLLLAPLVGWVTLHFAWKVSFVVLGLLVWAIALPAAIFIVRDSPQEIGLWPDGDVLDPPGGPNSEHPPTGPVASQQTGWTLGAAVRHRAFWWLWATWFLAATGQSGILQHQVPILIEAGMVEAVAATALGLTAGFGGFGKVGFGRLSEILPFRYAAMLCFALQGAAILPLLMARDQATLWAFIVLFGFSMGGLVVLLPLAVSHFFGLASFGVILGALGPAQALGGAVGALASGLIHDHAGSYQVAFLAFAGVYLVSVFTMFMAGQPRPRHR